MVSSMVTESTDKLVETNIRENSKMVNDMVKANIHGPMETAIWGHGRMINSMATVSSFQQTVSTMRAPTNMVNGMAKENLSGQMETITRDLG